METQDMRFLSPAEQSVLRQRAVAAVLKGEQQCRIAEIFQVSEQTLSGWMKDYRERGEASFVYQKRGCKPGGGVLKPQDGECIVELMTTKTPDQLGLPFFLWTRAAVVELIEQRYQVRISLQCASLYLARWNMTPQKPVRRAWQQDPLAVQRWLEETFPRIKEDAKHRGAQILWIDEMGVRSDDQVGRTYGLRGQTPVVPVSGTRFRCNMISAVTNQGTLHFKLFTERFTAPVMLDFLERLMLQVQPPKIVICDGHPVHRSKMVREWFDLKKDVMWQEFLPPYSPELNPDELLNQDVKTNAARNRRPRNQQEMLFNLQSYLEETQRSPEIVRNYFLGAHVRYATG
jgi:transposase